MALLHITVMGGLVPRATARRLPDAGAQVAINLLASAPEFRPVKGDTTVVAATGINNPKTIYRLQRKSDGSLNTDFSSAATWKFNAGEVSYVRGQLNGDLTERTYVSFNDGSAAPRVIDAAGGDRQLGVPKPTTAPTVTVNEVDEFTAEDRAGEIESLLLSLKTNVAAVLTPTWVGATRPGTGTDGYADRASIAGLPAEESQQLRLYRTDSTGGANTGKISNVYTGADASRFGHLFDGGLGGFWKTAASGWPGWAGTTFDHWIVPFAAYGLTYEVDEPALSAQLAALKMPGDPDTDLLTEGQVDEIIDAVADLSDQLATEAQPSIDALKAKVAQVKVLLDGGTAAANVQTLTAYYASSPITTLISNAVAAAAESIWSQALLAASYVDYTGAGEA
mgnify:CR=1 FL=1